VSADIINIEPYLPLYTAGLALYRSGGLRPGSSTGWRGLDEFYTVAPSQWTVITGIPGSGKSEFLDAMLVNLAEREPWTFAVYSPENCPTETHLVKLIEKRMRKPFGQGVTERMTEQEYSDGAFWVMERFFWLSPEMKTPDELIAAAVRHQHDGCRFGVVLDPWNTLEHQRGSMSETDYISFILTEVTQLCRAAKAHIWLVVHPTKIQRNKDGTRPVPTPYDISGSAHWYNKADNIITVHREQAVPAAGEPDRRFEVDVHVQKVRFKHCGHVGGTRLHYDKVTGRYFDPPSGTVYGEQYIDPERSQQPPTTTPVPRWREPGEEG
jgi:twinkle protein